MIPDKLRPGDMVQVVAPSTTLAVIGDVVRQVAGQNLASLGLTVHYSRHAEEQNRFRSSAVASRIADLHTAFTDGAVHGILSGIGGFNSNQLLEYLDYDLIQAHPKILCGYSDITALACAIYSQTGLVTYSGPHFSTFGMRQGLEYTLANFQACLMRSEPFEAQPAPAWSDDAWYKDQDKRCFEPNPGYQVIQEGLGEGRLIGGNLCTLNLLQGTRFMPALQDCLLFVEDDEESQAAHFDRDLQSLLQQTDLTGLRGLVIGRFQRASQIEPDALVEIVRTKHELAGVPVIAQADFGHTTPHLTLPIGGTARLAVKDGQVNWRIITH